GRERFLVLGSIIALFTLVPFLILNYIDSPNNETLTVIFHSALPSLIPGYYFVFGLFYFAFIVLFIYGIFSIGREKSFLYKIKFFRRIKTNIEEKQENEILKLEIDNQNMNDSYAVSVIPQQYRTFHAMAKMREYLTNTRTNSLSKAIEVYELELHRERELALQSAALASARRSEENTKQAQASAKNAEQSANAAAYRRRRY